MLAAHAELESNGHATNIHLHPRWAAKQAELEFNGLDVTEDRSVARFEQVSELRFVSPCFNAHQLRTTRSVH